MKLTPTKQQVAIIEAARTAPAMKIVAGSGSAKSTTLCMIAEDQKVPCLYLAYNKAMATEAKEKFPDNVECRSTHSLAYKYCGIQIAHKLSRPEGGYVNVAGTPTEIAKYYNVAPIKVGEDSYINSAYLSCIIKETVAKFEQSKRKNICKKSIPYNTEDDIVKRYGKEFVSKVKKVVLEVATRLWKDRCNPASKVLATHDTYLKLFELSDIEINDYTVVFLDEAQDANNCTISILDSKFPNSKIYVVGDDYQQIYQFRGSVNALSSMKGQAYTLSKSFRFGHNIADIATKILGGKFVLEGNEKVKSVVGSSDLISKHEKRTEIFRTNSALIERGISLLAEGVSVFIDYDTRDFINKLTSTQALHDGAIKNVKHVSILPFNEFSELVVEAEHDNELKRLASIVSGGLVGHYISALTYYKKPNVYDVHLITAHRSKGLEFENVMLASDFPSVFDKNGAYVGLQEFEENLLYVAATRAKKKLQYNNTVADILSHTEAQTSKFSIGNINIRQYNTCMDLKYDPVISRMFKDMDEEDEYGTNAVGSLQETKEDLSFYTSVIQNY